MDKSLPRPVQHLPATRPVSRPGRTWRVLLAAVSTVLLLQLVSTWRHLEQESAHVPLHASENLDKCRLLDVKPGPRPDFNLRAESDRFVKGTPPTLIKNAKIWTGRLDGLEILHGDILLDKGLIKEVGHVDSRLLATYANLVTVDAAGSWVSPGIVDLHSHLGVDSSPSLRGANDGNSFKGPILPWLRALDGLNTHDEAYKLSISGGVTTALVLPGSANAIGGQAIVIKLRPTEARTPTSMLLENPYSTNISEYNPSVSLRWKQIKHACGENPDRVYSGTRMDTTWAFRQAYDKARQVKEAQDAYCSEALAGRWRGLGNFPEDYQWQPLVDVLRGRVKVQTHCYETVDLDDLVRITNEFKFPIAAFHHAHETYLVPDTLKSAYDHPPAIALFATQARYKREAYRGSEFAPRILTDNGLQVVMKSDHPVTNSRYLLWEAQQAHYYGLSPNLALASVTTTPATVMGQDHRVGYIKKGYDADIVVWDSHPLALGAAPKQVWIDGIAQIESPHSASKPHSSQILPETPDFDKEAADAVKYDGLPPLAPEHSKAATIVFTNVSSIFLRDGHSIKQVLTATGANSVAVVQNARLACHGAIVSCLNLMNDPDAQYVDLEGGSLSPGLVTYGSPVGLQEIQAEPSTQDGYAPDPLTQNLPSILGSAPLIRAMDGLQFETRDALLAYRAGVTRGIVAPKSVGFLAGLSTVFSLGAKHKLETGAVIQKDAALHVSVHYGSSFPSVSTQIAALRALLLAPSKGSLSEWVSRIQEGEVPLVVDVDSADAIASLIQLKAEVEEEVGSPIQVTLTGATEAHLLAKEIGAANIGVILNPARPFPSSWEQRRILPGPPLSQNNVVSELVAHNVTVGLGTNGPHAARNARFDASWAALESGGEISKADALALVSVNLEKLLGAKVKAEDHDLVATYGGDLLDFTRVAGIVSPSRGVVDIL